MTLLAWESRFLFYPAVSLMRKDCFDLIARAKLHGLPVALATNGTLVDQRMAERIANAGVHRVSVSIDGADAQTHDGPRGIEGSFDQACGALRRLHAAGVSTQINATITRLNHHQRNELYALAEELEVDALHCFILVPVGCGAELAEEVRLSPGEIELFLWWLHGKAQSGSLFVKATCAPQYHRILHRDAERRHSIPAVQTHGMSATTRAASLAAGCVLFRIAARYFPAVTFPLRQDQSTISRCPAFGRIRCYLANCAMDSSWADAAAIANTKVSAAVAGPARMPPPAIRLPAMIAARIPQGYQHAM